MNLYYRTYNKKTNKMIYNVFDTNNPYAPKITATIDDENSINMFYVGKKDENGKMIYSGDILKFWEGIENVFGIIVWDEERLQFRIYTKLEKEVTIYNRDLIYPKSLSFDEIKNNVIVIGNIYENKELLYEFV